MKRTAETQLTKDNADNNDEAEEIGGSQKADAESLATRKIKGLPKRPPSSSVTALNPSSPSIKNETSGPSRFGAFSGFGTTPANNEATKNAFSPLSSFPIPSFSGFGSATTTTVNTNSPGIRKTYQASTSSLPSSSIPPISSLFSNVSTAATANSTSTSQNPAQKFYINLRGLNVSFLKAVQEAIDKDPFADFSSINENYRKIRENIEKEYESSKAQPPKTTTPAPSTSSAASPSFTMPIPPAKFSFTATPLASGTSSASGFSWPPLAAAASSSSSSSSSSTSSSSSFSFGAPKPPTSGFFVFGNPADGDTSKTATAEKPEEKEKQTTDSKPSGSSNSTAPQNFFKSPSAPMTPGFASFLSPPSSLTSSPKSPSTAFGSSLANNGNIGNPVGFSFGNVTPQQSAPANGPPTPTDLQSAPAKQEATEEDSDAGTSQNLEGESKENSINPYDKDSVGEEDEETLFETKSRAYISITGENNQKTWSSVGAGQLKLKKKKDGERRRLLMRNSSNGKIIVNTLIVPGFKVTADGKSISFLVPNENGTADFFKLRLSTENDAKEWVAKVSQK